MRSGNPISLTLASDPKQIQILALHEVAVPSTDQIHVLCQQPGGVQQLSWRDIHLTLRRQARPVFRTYSAGGRTALRCHITRSFIIPLSLPDGCTRPLPWKGAARLVSPIDVTSLYLPVPALTFPRVIHPSRSHPSLPHIQVPGLNSR
jgi:hypothetical protein